MTAVTVVCYAVSIACWPVTGYFLWKTSVCNKARDWYLYHRPGQAKTKAVLTFERKWSKR